MKFTAPTKSLHTACKLLGKVARPKNPSAILSSVKADPTGWAAVQLSATDNESALKLTVTDIEWDNRGEPVMLPLAMLNQILDAALDENITIDASAEKCIVSSDGSYYELFTMPTDGFPPPAECDGNATFEINAGVLGSIIKRVEFATAKQDTKYAITGIFLEVNEKDSTLSLIATDTRRCAVATGPLTLIGALPAHTIIPGHALELLKDLLGDKDAAVSFTISEKRVEFSVGQAVLGARLLEGRFPPYQEIIPKRVKQSIELPTQALRDRLKQAQIVTDAEHRQVAFEFSTNTLTLKAETGTAGLSQISLPCVYADEPRTILFNPEHVMVFLERVGCETVQLQLADGNKPAVFRAGDGYLYVVMPMS